MIGRIELFFRDWRRRMSRSEWIINLLGLPVSKDTASEPGLVLIQIDALSRRQLERALERGRLPFLSSLLQKEHYETRTFYSGVPSSTPAVQGELFYGVRCAVPAFSYFDRTARKLSNMLKWECAKAVEDDLLQRGDGLLQGGSSWSNIYRGGATPDESHFCAASLGAGDLFRPRPLLQSITFPILHFPSLLRLVALLLLEFLLAIWDMSRGVFRGESFLKEFRFVFFRVLVCIGLRELITIGVKIDVTRGLPIVHANFIGYDEQAHRRGPSSAFAHWSLKGIDRAIKNICRAAQRSARRDYQVWIFSDHGQEATSFFTRRGVGIEQVIHDALNGGGPACPPARGYPDGSHSRAHWPRRRTARLAEGCHLESGGSEAGAWFAITAMGPVGHLYLLRPEARAKKWELATRLIRDAQVPGVLLRNQAGQVEWLHAQGRWLLPEDAAAALPHPEPLRLEVARDLSALCEHPCAGDLLLLGWSPKSATASFVNERGSHAGPGPEETQGFILLPALTRLPEQVREFVRPSDLRAAILDFLERRPLPTVSRNGRRRSKSLRVMTDNVHGCCGMDGRVSPRRIARIIERYEPDLVALQELDLGRVRSQRHDQPRLIAEALGMTVSFCPTVIDQDEQYGHAILSRLPLEVIRIEILRGYTQTRHVEPRGALWVRLEVEGLILNLMNTHFGLRRRERLAQANELLGEGWIGNLGLDDPLILCGDFNMIPRSDSYRALARRLRDVQSESNGSAPLNTFMTFHPFTRIDHVFVSHHFLPERIFVPRDTLTRVASDHLPLIVDLTFQARPDSAQPEPS